MVHVLDDVRDVMERVQVLVLVLVLEPVIVPAHLAVVFLDAWEGNSPNLQILKC